MAKLNATFISMLKEPILSWLNASLLGRAQRNNIISARVLSILDSVKNHHEVDDSPYGGGAGELMRVDIIAPLIAQALSFSDNICRSQKRVILLDPTGFVFDQAHAQKLSNFDELIFVCGRFEGIDARVYNFVDEALSLGDFVMSCGELAALSIFDATARLVPGVLGNNASLACESHVAGRLESSNYTRPVNYQGLLVPEVLQSGNHKLISKSQKCESIIKTSQLRPDLLEKFPLDHEEKALLLEAKINSSSYYWQKIYEQT